MADLGYAKPNAKEVLKGLFIPELKGSGVIGLAISLLGAMAHSLPALKTLVLSRKIPPSVRGIKQHPPTTPVNPTTPVSPYGGSFVASTPSPATHILSIVVVSAPIFHKQTSNYKCDYYVIKTMHPIVDHGIIGDWSTRKNFCNEMTVTLLVYLKAKSASLTLWVITPIHVSNLARKFIEFELTRAHASYAHIKVEERVYQKLSWQLTDSSGNKVLQGGNQKEYCKTLVVEMCVGLDWIADHLE
ncbi:hypothetical protein Fmac_026162 [Flemingia macrophylla]|uniref:Uncharacterized protein n=1 Tax=Flemingia macrophylla TaxID=520843 RepID=A0ABD1LEM7_9FABA